MTADAGGERGFSQDFLSEAGETRLTNLLVDAVAHGRIAVAWPGGEQAMATRLYAYGKEGEPAIGHLLVMENGPGLDTQVMAISAIDVDPAERGRGHGEHMIRLLFAVEKASVAWVAVTGCATGVMPALLSHMGFSLIGEVDGLFRWALDMRGRAAIPARRLSS